MVGVANNSLNRFYGWIKSKRSAYKLLREAPKPLEVPNYYHRTDNYRYHYSSNDNYNAYGN